MPFLVKDCSLAAIATGTKAQTLSELRDHLLTVPTGAVYFHFWGGRLRTTFEHSEYHNDFSFWAQNSLHDDILAERLELINPVDCENIEGLRLAVVAELEKRLDEREEIVAATRQNRFHFMRSNILVFSTPLQMSSPRDLLSVIPQMSRSSLFYHFIDARRRTPDGKDDFTTWLRSYGDEYKTLIAAMATIDPFFISLKELQSTLITTIDETLRSSNDTK